MPLENIAFFNGIEIADSYLDIVRELRFWVAFKCIFTTMPEPKKKLKIDFFFRSLSNCGLEQVIEIGKGKGSIRSLDLSNNKINKIRSLNFAGWQSLDTLDLTNNNLRLVFNAL